MNSSYSNARNSCTSWSTVLRMALTPLNSIITSPKNTVNLFSFVTPPPLCLD
jgi:hypothetical protein